MRFQQPLVTAVISGILLASGLALNVPAQAQARRFICAKVNGVYTTIAKTPKGDRPVVRWRANDFQEAGWTPDRRCREVSAKFQEYFVKGTLKYLTTGRVRGQNVICTATRKGGPCAGLLMTVRPGQNPNQTLQNLLTIRANAAGPLNETSDRLYIDVNDFLGDEFVDQQPERSSAVTPEPTLNPASSPQPTQGKSTQSGDLW
jgi:hypothetical protein